jgi:DUF4097 and DUF4098 domain-containing protein YvlB
MFGSKQYTYEEGYTDTIQLSGQAVLTLENTNGTVEITGSDTANALHLEVTKRVRSHNLEDAKDHIGDITITDELRPEDVHVRVEHPSSSRRDYGVDFVITVPTRFGFTIQSGNGDVALSSASGNATIALGNGSIDLTDVDSDQVVVELGNGDTDMDLTLSDTCSVTVAVGNGTITLRIPADTNASVEASVGNGTITTSGLDFDHLHTSTRRLRGVLGNGAGVITLTTGNGNISLEGK